MNPYSPQSTEQEPGDIEFSLPRVPVAQASGASLESLLHRREFVGRHIGPDDDQIREMLGALGLDSLDELAA